MITLLILIIAGCKTTQLTKIALPPSPGRSVIKAPKTEEDYKNLLIYYESLVQQWEAWGTTVNNILVE